MAKEEESCYNQIDTSLPKKKRSKSNQEDNTEKPKKPRSAYLLYYFDVHQRMQQEIPYLPQSEINKRISESWRRLSVAEKGYYLDKAKLEKEGTDYPLPCPSKELPGFRKILPRANYFVLAEGCNSLSQPEDSMPDVSTESLDSVNVSQCPPSGPTGEVELYPQAVSGDDMAEETAVASHSGTHAIPPYASFSVLQNTETTSDTDLTRGINKTMFFVNTPSGSEHEETAQVVALIPTQNLLEQNSVRPSMRQVMVVSLESNTMQSTKPSFNMPVKTYTRRGRGKCPSCSFVYLSRHKPPTCPECGSHLGGKWKPAEKKTKVKELVVKKSNKSSQVTSSSVEGKNAAVGKAETTGVNNKEQTRSCSRKQHATTAGKSTGGSSTKTKAHTKSMEDHVKGGTSQEKTIVQKKPVRPILPAYSNKKNAVFKIITVPSNKGSYTSANSTLSTGPSESLSILKPSTLKQLGQAVPTNTAKQDSSVSGSVEGPCTAASLDKGMNIVSVVPFKNTVSSFNLGLSTARGRGHCKNPACDYMYKNRHKPAVCPKCGYLLSQKDTKIEKFLDPYKPLSLAQKDLQRQSTLQLLRHSLHFAESETELQETLSLIQELNSLQIILVHQSDQEQEDNVETETMFESGWPQFFESAATHCSLCSYPLFKGGQITVAGQVDCWLLTETLLNTASLQLKVCLNVQCLALHSFTDLPPGLFNIGNRLLVSIDLFLRIRANIKLGHTPGHCVRTLLDHLPSHPIHTLSPKDSCQVQELLLSGYWAFECLTVRDYNDMICGICGVAPKLEIAQRYTNNALELKNVEFIWPDGSVPDEVHVDDFWLTMESEAIEQAAFPSDIPIIRVDASIIAPFIPPLMRSQAVINTEKDKVLSPTGDLSGDPSVLVRLIHDGLLRLDKLEDHSEEELRTILQRCGTNITAELTREELLASLVSMCTRVPNGLSTAPQPSHPHLTAGKLSKVCPHKVVCGSKCLVRRETARDHVDLLLSSRYWPPVYVSDCAHQVALCADMQYPEQATQMWGRNQGCFCDPFEDPEIVSCAELQDQPYSTDLSSGAENQQVHPITKSLSRWLVHPVGQTQEPPSPKHHSMHLCRDLEPYISLVNESRKDKKEQTAPPDQADSSETAELSASEWSAQEQPVVFNNTAHYYLYNRLVDFITSRDIVNQQISEVLQACQPGEVVIRDTLYRLGVAKIDTEKDEEVSETPQTQAAEAEALDPVELHE